MRHPQDVLFAGERPFPILPAVDHYAGSEKLIRKAMALQQQLGPIFDITCDCEDGAKTGAEPEHARMIAELIGSTDNHFARIGARIHDISHPHWEQDLAILIAGAGQHLPFITLPKPRAAADVAAQIDRLRALEQEYAIHRKIPVHVLIETHGALREVWEIAALPGVESLDFGLMDFVSAHHGAIPGSAMRSPGQFEHPLVVRAKTEIAAAALAHGLVPTHNVTTELQDRTRIREDARIARLSFAFLRMWSIHPNQIEPILEAMRPDYSEIALSVDILYAAQQADWGPIQHQGTLHDRASYRYYWNLLQRAHNTGASLPNGAQKTFFTAPQPDRPS